MEINKYTLAIMSEELSKVSTAKLNPLSYVRRKKKGEKKNLRKGKHFCMR